MKSHLADVAFRRAIALIRALDEVLSEYGDQTLQKGVMKTAQRILSDSEQISGKKLKRTDDLLHATDAAFQTAMAYIEAVEGALDGHGDAALNKGAMEAAGQRCAKQILADCEEILGKRLETADELLVATNRRRKQGHHSVDAWERQGNQARLKIAACNCTLVRAGLAKPNPVHCLCSRGMIESLFLAVCQGPVRVDIIKAEGFGDNGCEFCVTFVE